MDNTCKWNRHLIAEKHSLKAGSQHDWIIPLPKCNGCKKEFSCHLYYVGGRQWFPPFYIYDKITETNLCLIWQHCIICCQFAWKRRDPREFDCDTDRILSTTWTSGEDYIFEGNINGLHLATSFLKRASQRLVWAWIPLATKLCPMFRRELLATGVT